MSSSDFQPEHGDQDGRPRRRSRCETLELANLEADLAVKEREVRDLDDRHDLAELKLQQQRMINEGLETRLALIRISVVLVGAILVAGAVLSVMDPATRHLGGRLLLEAIKAGESGLPSLVRG